MKEKRVDCFVPYESDAQVRETVEELKADSHVAHVHLMKADGPGKTQTLLWMAEQATHHIYYCTRNTTACVLAIMLFIVCSWWQRIVGL